MDSFPPSAAISPRRSKHNASEKCFKSAIPPWEVAWLFAQQLHLSCRVAYASPRHWGGGGQEEMPGGIVVLHVWSSS